MSQGLDWTDEGRPEHFLSCTLLRLDFSCGLFVQRLFWIVFKSSALEGEAGEHDTCFSGLVKMRWDTP